MDGAPETIGRFRVEKLLSQGESTLVYRAYDPTFELDVALKILKPELADDETARANLLGEARLQRSVEHPSIVSVRDIDEYEGRPFFVMDYLGGGSLADRLQAGDVDSIAVDEVGLLAKLLADGLQQIHDAGLAHGDISAENVLVADSADQSGSTLIGSGTNLFITDFGSAAHLEEDNDVEAEGLQASTAGVQPSNSSESSDESEWDLSQRLRELDIEAASQLVSQVVERSDSVMTVSDIGIPLTPLPRRHDTSALDAWLASVDQAVTEPPAPRRRWPLLAACALGAVFVAGLAWAFVNGPADEEEADGTTTETSEERDGTTTSLEPDDPEPAGPTTAATGGAAEVGAELTLTNPMGVDFGPDGSLYFADAGSNRVLRITTEGTVEVVAGSGRQGYGGDRGPATDAELYRPSGVAVDNDGVVYFSDRFNHAIRRVDPDGTISTFAGTGTFGYSGDGGPAASAQLSAPFGLDIMADGSLVIADSSNARVRTVDADGIIRTIAGSGPASQVQGPDGLPADQTQISFPSDVAVTAQGTLLVLSFDGRLRELQDDGTFRTVAADSSEPGDSGDNGPATEARVNGPNGIATSADGRIAIVDTFNHRIRVIETDGTISTLAGTGESAVGNPTGLAASTPISTPVGAVFSDDGSLVFGEYLNNVIRVVDTDGQISTIAGTARTAWKGDGQPATEVQLAYPSSLGVGPDGAIYFGELLDGRLRRVDPNGTIGSAGPPDLVAAIVDISSTSDGDLILTSGGNPRVMLMAPDGSIEVILGYPTYPVAAGDQIGADLALNVYAVGDQDGGVYVSDTQNNVVLRVSRDGEVTRVAGNGEFGLDGDDGPAVDAQLAGPGNLAVGPDGSLYFVDIGSLRIRRVDAEGTITTVAGTGTSASSGDGGPAVGASFIQPYDIAFDESERLYILDVGADVIRRVAKDSQITTIVSHSEETPLINAEAIAVGNDRLYVAEPGLNRIYSWDDFGQVEVVAGRSQSGSG